ncbi:hypothetical protein GBAR_LOCUS18209 [Geodia barretti]|uniref:Uncharacterized protein n=1 Tax=Geodia barretti TaxID=519541 RepID=A0AA35SL75_GEOBA|nr:hypothetical protein GBAR_LOCUS18209 [Geodia barretti]
MSQRQRRRS